MLVVSVVVMTEDGKCMADAGPLVIVEGEDEVCGRDDAGKDDEGP